MASIYKVVSFTGRLSSGGTVDQVARQLEDLLNRSAGEGLEFCQLGEVRIAVQPGCLGGLLGADTSYTATNVIPFKAAGAARMVEFVSSPSALDDGLQTSAAGAAGTAISEDDWAVETAESLAASSRRTDVAPSEDDWATATVDTPPENADVTVPEADAATAPTDAAASTRQADTIASNTGTPSKMPLYVGIGVALLIALVMFLKYLFSAPHPAPAAPQAVYTPPVPAAAPPVSRASREPAPTPAPSTGGTFNVQTLAWAPGVAGGDTYTFETIDHLEPKLNNVTVRTVISVGAHGFEMNVVNAKSGYSRKLYYDADSNLLSTRGTAGEGADYSPALQYFKFPLKSGDTWSATATEKNIKTGATRTHFLRGRVGNFEQVSVPAGTFQAIRIEIDSEVDDGGKRTFGQDISWYSPDVRKTVKSELESRDPQTGKSGRRTVSLLSYRLVSN